MGLDMNNNAWHSSYSTFHDFRCAIAKALELPPLNLMEGFYNSLEKKGIGIPTLYYNGIHLSELQWNLKLLDERLPIRWDCLKFDPLHKFLYHSDCDGIISCRYLKPIIKRFREIKPKMPGIWQPKLKQLIKGIELCIKNHQPLKFR